MSQEEMPESSITLEREGETVVVNTERAARAIMASEVRV